jgi:hypothetical protein
MKRVSVRKDGSRRNTYCSQEAKPEFWDVGGQQAELEIYTDKVAFDKACAHEDADDSESVK